MAGTEPKLRFTESLPGRAAGWLLAALWIFSMSGVDSHSFSAYPTCVVLLVVLLLAGVGILSGTRLVRMSRLGWFTLAAAGYFLVRCVNSYAVTDSYEDEAIILGAIVYYAAGIYVAQNQRYSSLFFVLGLALVLNMVAFWATKQPWFCLEWTGRATETPEGRNNIPTSLFIYKNFAGFFFVAGGLVLGCWSLWNQKGLWRAVSLLVAVGAVALSFFCRTRVPYVMLPLALVVMWCMDVVMQLYSGKKIGLPTYMVGFVFLVLFLLVGYDLLFGNVVGFLFNNADSHMRYYFWSAVCEILPHTPAWGCGAGATEWEVIPYCDLWQLINYAHNDYLQAWVDYGIIAVILVVLLIVMHVVQAFRCMASESVNSGRRALSSVAFLVVVLLAAYATADFPWHSYALVCMGAFSCGILASPFVHERLSVFSTTRWAAGSSQALVPVRAQQWPGKVILFLILACVVFACYELGGRLRPAWLAQWEYNRLSQADTDSQYKARRALIAGLMPHYPCPALADTYFAYPLYDKNFAEQEQLLRMAVDANPKQLFTAVMLADVLDRQHKFEAAEKLMRATYAGDAMQDSCLGRWASYYAHHLLLWGRYEMQQGGYGKAASLLDYALRMHKNRSVGFNLQYRNTRQHWLRDGKTNKYLRDLIRSAGTDLRLMRQIGIQPDDSWQEPMEKGGKHSLYCSWVKKSGK